MVHDLKNEICWYCIPLSKNGISGSSRKDISSWLGSRLVNIELTQSISSCNYLLKEHCACEIVTIEVFMSLATIAADDCPRALHSRFSTTYTLQASSPLEVNTTVLKIFPQNSNKCKYFPLRFTRQDCCISGGEKIEQRMEMIDFWSLKNYNLPLKICKMTKALDQLASLLAFINLVM